MTAVEWLEKELYEKFEIKGDYILYSEILYKAKEMFEQQIIDAYNRKNLNTIGFEFTNGKEYFDETFKK